MSNAEKMVMVPRKLLMRIYVHLWERPALHSNDYLEVRKILAQPAQQHQGEPVTENTRRRRERWIESIRAAMKFGVPKHLRASLERAVKEIENSIQHGGIQRLRVRCEELEQDLSGLTKYTDALISQHDEGWMEREMLRVQMGERDSLLRESSEFMYIMTGNNAPRDLDAEYGKEGWEGAISDLRGRIAVALSASAEPSAPVEIDDPMAPSYPEIPKHQMFVHVLILEAGENSYSEAVYGRDGYFRFGYDEPPIEDVEHWMNLPTREQARAALERKP